ncbi:MAG: hypothetical protein EP298_09900 [Gammaproteobacteria bacterium]|nr:MAG: hypothetical protein EP298_09900 [Gammaproteobacteria bacterium]UTW41543.1 hypothetical protein KFE69_08475 [bacterium SCSIO 12844]
MARTIQRNTCINFLYEINQADNQSNSVFFALDSEGQTYADRESYKTKINQVKSNNCDNTVKQKSSKKSHYLFSRFRLQQEISFGASAGLESQHN